MGLKEVKFIDWFRGKFPSASRIVAMHEGAHFDSVFIDVNCILHPSMRAAKNEGQFVKKLFTILDRTLSQFVPDRICYLSVDGPAPLAKLLTQKARRASKVQSLCLYNNVAEQPFLHTCVFKIRANALRLLSCSHPIVRERKAGSYEHAASDTGMPVYVATGTIPQLLYSSLLATSSFTRNLARSQVCYRPFQQSR